nr:MAG: hypothetical protein OI716_00795 [Candidatus Methanoperedens sp.]WAI00086.1 MAG: hypothetical protein OI720_00640 [Candidatus Methanoperedens sp.]
MIFFGGRRDRDEDDSESGILGGIGGIIGKDIWRPPHHRNPFTYIGPNMLRAWCHICIQNTLSYFGTSTIPFTGKEVFFHVNCEFT